MHVGVRIYATQARGVMYSPPPGIFPSTGPDVRRSVLHHSGARWFWAICYSDVGRGTRSTVKRHTAIPVSHPTITPGLPRGIPPPACATCPPFATVFRPPIDNRPFVAIDLYRGGSSNSTVYTQQLFNIARNGSESRVDHTVTNSFCTRLLVLLSKTKQNIFTERVSYVPSSSIYYSICAVVGILNRFVSAGSFLPPTTKQSRRVDFCNLPTAKRVSPLHLPIHFKVIILTD